MFLGAELEYVQVNAIPDTNTSLPTFNPWAEEVVTTNSPVELLYAALSTTLGA